MSGAGGLDGDDRRLQHFAVEHLLYELLHSGLGFRVILLFSEVRASQKPRLLSRPMAAALRERRDALDSSGLALSGPAHFGLFDRFFRRHGAGAFHGASHGAPV